MKAAQSKVGIEHDINKLVAKFKRTGQMPSLRYDGMKFDDGENVIDLTGIGDFQECQNRIAQAAEMFDAYPSVIRRRFNNNVEDFVTFMGSLNNKEKLDEALRLGIVELKKKRILANHQTTRMQLRLILRRHPPVMIKNKLLQ